MDHRCLLDTPDEELPSSRLRKAKVYVDCNSFGPRAIEAAVSLYGADRIVCGTDGTEFGCDWTRKALAEAQIGEDAREQILHRNAAALLARTTRSTNKPPPNSPGATTPGRRRRGRNAPALPYGSAGTTLPSAIRSGCCG